MVVFTYANIEIIFNKLAFSIFLFLFYFLKMCIFLECQIHSIEIVYCVRAIYTDSFFHLCKSNCVILSDNLFYDEFSFLFNWGLKRDLECLTCQSNILYNYFSVTHAITVCSGVVLLLLE